MRYYAVMNYYERIGRSIVFIENNLEEEFSIEQAAQEAFMSMSNFYRMFMSIAGFTVKEYIRRRRLSKAYEDLRSQKDLRVLDAAVKYGYTSADAFTRSFREEFGINPSELQKGTDKAESCSKEKNPKGLRRINIMDEYFELQDKKLLEEYPDIKLLKKLEPMKTACFKYFGKDCEQHAFEEMKKWIDANGILFNKKDDNGQSAYRIFGFNNPDPSNPEGDETYGYEVCITIDDELYRTLQDAPYYGLHESYPSVMRKTLNGGMFAVVSIKRESGVDLGYNIMRGWQRFNKWMELSKYIWGGQQYLEEHLDFSDEGEHVGGVDLYMPIQEAPQKQASLRPVPLVVKPLRTAFIRVTGDDSEKAAVEAWEKIIGFAKKYNLKSEETRIFMYGSGFAKTPPFFHEILITLPEGFSFSDDEIKEKEFSGGLYRTVKTDQRNQYNVWAAMEQWAKETKTKAGRHQWAAEWHLEGWSFPAKEITVLYPVQE